MLPSAQVLNELYVLNVEVLQSKIEGFQVADERSTKDVVHVTPPDGKSQFAEENHENATCPHGPLVPLLSKLQADGLPTCIRPLQGLQKNEEVLISKAKLLTKGGRIKVLWVKLIHALDNLLPRE